MAKVLGESGRYASDEAVKQRGRIWLTVCSVLALVGLIEGLLLSNLITHGPVPAWSLLTVSICAAGGAWALFKWGDKKLDALDKKRVAMLRGASGEVLVGNTLANFPEEFCVINGLTTPFGDLDHVVVGPTDTKNWRGVVSADGKDELLINEKPTDKPYVRHFVARMMKVREKVAVLAPGMDVFYNALFVFTSARVEAKWGTTKSLNCITDDQLHSYIVEKDFGKKLKPTEVEIIAQAFLGLAHMDKGFSSRSPD